MKYTRFPGDLPTPGEAGGKAGSLAALSRAGLPVPEWFVILPEAFFESMPPALRAKFGNAEESSEVMRMILTVRLESHVSEEIDKAYRQLAPADEHVAVRSSAIGEDGLDLSFAGQLDSFLFVPKTEIASKVAAVWQSAFSDRILAYRREHGVKCLPRPPAVVVQRMVDPEVAGVAFSADPVTGRWGTAVVSSVYGLGTSLVSGECDADTFRVDGKGAIVERVVADKRIAHHAAPGTDSGTKTGGVPDGLQRQPSLADEQVKEIAALARKAARLFGCPQDIEWAYGGGRLYLLQSRPITSLKNLADPDGVFCLWDNSNIIESYSGITTPLTYSFARNAYEAVYREFCRLMGVPRATILGNAPVFRRMIGLVEGRIYYSLLSWYKALAMLPGFKVNRHFMEQMMGVREGMPDSVIREAGPATFVGRLKDSLRLLRMLASLLYHHFTMQAATRRFYRRLERALRQPDVALKDMRLDELAAYYEKLERDLLVHWDAPLVNDFFAMIFFGLLRKLVQRWGPDHDEAIHNDLVSGEGGMIGTEPVRRMIEMASEASADADLVEALCVEPVDRLRVRIAGNERLRQLYESYLLVFGDRSFGELKLENPTLQDDPVPLLRAIGQLARQTTVRARAGEAEAEGAEAARRRAVKLMSAALGWHLFRRAVFGWVLRNARARVRGRENLRFERTRVFGRVRTIFSEMGKRLSAIGALEAPRDVFYLSIEELLGFVNGTAVSTGFREVVRIRKEEYARYAAGRPPDRRFSTTGAVHQGNVFRESNPVDVVAGEFRQGIGCYPGIVRGTVRVVMDPRESSLQAGEILVAEQTDPGWVILFPAASGLIVERGSLLSHSAIVAREMGLPAVVSVPGLTTWLATGDTVELDGKKGTVRRLEARNG